MATNVCIRINTGEHDEGKRRENANELKKKCPALRDWQKETQFENLLDAITKEMFPAGFPKSAYLRNLSGNGDRISFGIRPVKSEGDFIDRYFEENQTLLFKGHIHIGICYIDSIQIVQNTEMQDFESEQELFIAPHPLPDDNGFADCILSLESQRTETTKKLEEWRGYLKWRREIANKQIHGAKYFERHYDSEKKCVVFGLLFESKEAFDKEKRYLKRDACAFTNLISLDSWNFKYDRNLVRIDRTDLGSFQGFSGEHELSGNAEENPVATHEHPNSREKDKEIKNSSEQKFTEDDLREQFKSMYIVYSAYKLPEELIDDDSDDGSDSNSGEDSDKDTDKAIQDYLDDIPNNGFVALSAAGEFALIRRFETAINDLIEGNCYSQTLINWLFDVTKAALPVSEAEEITQWANPDIAQNENQRLAVQKAVNAMELFLLQGPPGTGKTTVIAEIIYQLAIRGLRVLVSSQSNDAVDNALDRLSNNPAIRAIRLGGRGGKKKKKGDDDECKYVEKDALKYYYKSLSDSISGEYVNAWSETEREMAQCQKDERDCHLIQKDLDSLRAETSSKQEKLDSATREYSDISAKIKEAEKTEQNAEQMRRQFERFAEFLRTGNPYDALPKELLSVLEAELSAVKETAEANEIVVPNNFIAAHSLFSKDVRALLEKLQDSKSTGSSNSEIDNLNAQIELCKQAYLKAVEDNDEDGIRTKKREWDNLKLSRDKLQLSGGLEFTSAIREAFSSDLQNLCKSDSAQACKKIADVLTAWNNSVKSAEQKMRERVSNLPKSDISALSERKNALEGKIKILREEVADKEKQRNAKQAELLQMKTRYGLTESATDLELSDAIAVRLGELKAKSEESAPLKNAFADTMQKFTQKLNDEKTYKYDNEFFLTDYINSCNVVGISCTNNMRNLSDKGFENFDVVIIDEVSKATPPELLIPLMKAGKVILVGDHRQLPPMFEEHEKSYKEMIDALDDDENGEDAGLKEILTEENFKKYKNMVTASLFKAYFEQADKSIKHSLLTQYRMHSDIMNVINRFYDGRLKNGLSRETENKTKAHNLKIDGIDGSSFIQPKNHVYWLDSSFLPSGTPINETFRENSTSACNVLEKHIILELLKKIAAEYKAQGHKLTKNDDGTETDTRISVGIISFYQRQVNEIRSEVKKIRASKEFKSDFESLDIDVNTVDRFQGKEKNIIITSLVRNNKFARASKHVVTYERINVAFSRVQNLLFIVGAKQMYSKLQITIPKMDGEGELTLPVYENIISDLERHGCFAKTSKLIPTDLEKSILAEYKAMGGK